MQGAVTQIARMVELNNFKIISVALVTFAISFYVLHSISQNKSNPCVVIITGESIKISGCVFDENFSKYASSLVIPNHWL